MESFQRNTQNAMTNIAASVGALCAIKDVTPEIAKAIRTVWKTTKESEVFAASPQTKEWVDTCYRMPKFREIRRHAIDCILGTHGIEFLGIYKPSGEDVYYCNAGDTYATTILFIGRRLIVTCWGELVEKNQIREVQ